MIRLSAAAIRRYRSCPKQFHLTRLGQADKQPASPRLAQANAIHDALERFFGLPLADRDEPNLHQCLRHVWPQHRKGAFQTRSEEIHYGVEALRMLSTFAAHGDLQAEPIAREDWLSALLSGGVELCGKVDRIDQKAEGGLEIVDYKTSRQPISEAALPGDVAAAIYGYLAERTFSQPVSALRYIYLPLGLEVSWQPQAGEVLEAAAAVEATIAEIKQAYEADSWPATPGRHCRFCPFALQCPERLSVSLDELVVSEEVIF